MALVKTALETSINTLLNPLLVSAFTTLFQDPVRNLPTDTLEQQALRTQLMAQAIITAQTWSTNITPQIASAVSTAVDVFVRTGTVTTPLGIPVATAGTALAQTGATTAPGIGVIS